MTCVYAWWACTLLLTTPAGPVIAEESIECPSQVGVLKGTKVTNLGGITYTYTETLELGREPRYSPLNQTIIATMP